MTPTDTEFQVCADITARQTKGVAKYGTSVRDNPLPLREWLEHAYEENLDAAIYLKRAMQEQDDNASFLDWLFEHCKIICWTESGYIEHAPHIKNARGLLEAEMKAVKP